jgi:hypothetical protein
MQRSRLKSILIPGSNLLVGAGGIYWPAHAAGLDAAPQPEELSSQSITHHPLRKGNSK